MLSIQTDRVEKGRAQVVSAQESFPTDGFEQLIAFFRRIFFSRSYFIKPEEMYLYLWALARVNSYALEQLNSLSDSSFGEIFDDKTALDKLISLYDEFLTNTRRRMESLVKKHAFLLTHLNEASAEKALRGVQIETLQTLQRNEIITNKLYIILQQELEQSN